DAARQILPEEIQVVALMQSNIDPHSYKPVESDVAKLNSATIVLHNGLHLEGKMTDILEKVGRSKPVYAMSSALKQNDLIEVGPNVHDPHIWFDLNLWARCVEGLGGFLALQYPEHSDDIIANTERYASELRTAHADFATALMDVSDSNRAMVTAHDAFSYFGRAFAIEVKGLQGVSTAAEFGVNDMRSTAEFIIERELTTVFTETSVNSKSIEALKEAVEQKGGEVKLGEPLFSDALGEQGTSEATLIGAFKYNTTQILNSLK
ncbi:MAG: zinc ABC transporter substrate-binding protein, partial [Cryomorphaceae bacterium]